MKGIAYFLLLIFGVNFIWNGGRYAYINITNAQPVVITCAEFARQKPKAQWLRLEECDFDVTDAIKLEKSGLFIPLRTANPTPDDKIHVMVKNPDASVDALFEPLLKSGTLTPKQIGEYYYAHEKELVGVRSVEGFDPGDNAFPFDDDPTKKKGTIKNAQTNLSDDFVILYEGEKPPALWSALAILFGGFALLGVLGFFVLRANKK